MKKESKYQRKSGIKTKGHKGLRRTSHSQHGARSELEGFKDNPFEP